MPRRAVVAFVGVSLLASFAAFTGACNVLTGASAIDYDGAVTSPPDPTDPGDAGRRPELVRPDASSPDPSAPPLPDVDASSDAPADASEPASRIVFVTASEFLSSIGGLASATTVCGMLANDAGLNSRVWTAWLSEAGKVDALSRLPATGSWHLRDGTLVAASRAALLSGTLAHAIDQDQTGAPLTGTDAFVWTGTSAAGKALGDDCNKWRSDLTLYDGIVGNAKATNATWTAATSRKCNLTARFYCLER